MALSICLLAENGDDARQMFFLPAFSYLLFPSSMSHNLNLCFTLNHHFCKYCLHILWDGWVFAWLHMPRSLLPVVCVLLVRRLKLFTRIIGPYGCLQTMTNCSYFYITYGCFNLRFCLLCCHDRKQQISVYSGYKVSTTLFKCQVFVM